MVKFTFAMTAHGKGKQTPAGTVPGAILRVALEASFSCPRYFTQFSKQKADWLIMDPVRQEENLVPWLHTGRQPFLMDCEEQKEDQKLFVFQ